MIKYVLVATAILYLISCTQINSTGEKVITQSGDTLGEVDISLSKMDLVEELSKIDELPKTKLLFKATGVEPGWFIEVFNNKMHLVVDYGKDSITVDDKFDDLNNANGYTKTIKLVKSEANTLVITLINKPCTDAGSGNTMDRSVIISYKGNKYTGCGTFMK